jgi:hypothetical protein
MKMWKVLLFISLIFSNCRVGHPQGSGSGEVGKADHGPRLIRITEQDSGFAVGSKGGETLVAEVRGSPEERAFIDRLWEKASCFIS